MNRKRYEWKLKDHSILLGERTLLMGILNVTPDSFSDAGKYNDPDRAFARAVRAGIHHDHVVAGANQHQSVF